MSLIDRSVINSNAKEISVEGVVLKVGYSSISICHKWLAWRTSLEQVILSVPSVRIGSTKEFSLKGVSLQHASVLTHSINDLSLKLVALPLPSKLAFSIEKLSLSWLLVCESSYSSTSNQVYKWMWHGIDSVEVFIYFNFGARSMRDLLKSTYPSVILSFLKVIKVYDKL